MSTSQGADLPTEMLSVAEDLLTLAAPKQVEKMRDALLAAYQRGHADGYDCAIVMERLGGPRTRVDLASL